MKSTVLLICLAVAVGLRATADLNSDEQGKVAIPSNSDSSDRFIGKDGGQVRDDNDLKMKFVWCPPRKLSMGSPPSEQRRINNEDQVNVTLTNGFWLGRCEVTQSEWKQVMKTEPWAGQKVQKEGADFPARFVSWDDASSFCRKLTEQERKAGRLSNDWEYTLPTEAQWERACRAGTDTRFSFGDYSSKLEDYAVWFAEYEDARKAYCQPVGQKRANPLGLYDMHGNVWEWCRDVYSQKLPGGRDPEVIPAEKTAAVKRVFRGGAWNSDAADCRSARRAGNEPGFRSDTIGFRVALSRCQAATTE